MGVMLFSHLKFPALKSMRNSASFSVSLKTYKASIFFAGLYTEFCGPLRRRFQANCLDIFNLLAETKKKVQKPMIKLIYYYFLNTNSAVC